MGGLRIGAAAVVAVAVTLAACGPERESPVEPPLEPEVSTVPGGTGNGWDLPLTGSAELARTFPGEPCEAPPHREFDFWVGEWNVSNPGGTHIGTNIVTSELDGCLVQEHWSGANGVRGRSLNAYDPETGAWHQTWASQVPQGLTGRLRTSGGIVDGRMVLTGQRDAAGGFTFLDRWTWEETAGGDVIQRALTRVPEFGLEFPFTGTYTRGAVTPEPGAVTGHCAAGAVGGETRRADFLVGSWTVSATAGAAVGTSTVETDLDDCLFVERFASVGGLRAVAFTYVDVWVERWYRTYIDSEGERLELEGGFDGGDLVLRGTEGTDAGDVEVRVTWRPEGSSVTQTWEVSGDDGGSWRRTTTLAYDPR